MLDYVEAVNQSKKIVSTSLPEIGYEFYVAPANFIILKVSESAAAVDLMKNRMAEKLATGFNRNKPVKSSSRLGELKTTGVGV
jgi:hypothetical protein